MLHVYLFASVTFILNVSLMIPSVYNKVIDQYRHAFGKLNRWWTEGSKRFLQCMWWVVMAFLHHVVWGTVFCSSHLTAQRDLFSPPPPPFFCGVLVVLPFLPLINVKQMKYSSVPNKLLNFNCVSSFIYHIGVKKTRH